MAARAKPHPCTPGTFDAKKRRKFLDAYAEGATVRIACKKAGISTVTVSNTVRKDPEFKRQYEEAMDRNTDALEQIVDGMARGKKPNMIACFFLLKARRPHVYRDNHTVQISAAAETVAAFVGAMAKVQGSATQT